MCVYYLECIATWMTLISFVLDDRGLAAERLAAAAVRLLDLFERALRLRVAHHKCVLLGSSRRTGDRLRHLLRDTGVRLESWGKKLGVQFSLQLRRRFSILRQRAAVARGRARRIGFFRARQGGRGCGRGCAVRGCCQYLPTEAVSGGSSLRPWLS